MPPWLRRVLETSRAGRGNPACWQMGFTYENCCFPAGVGNSACWDHTYNFDICCNELSAFWKSTYDVCRLPLRTLASGGAVLAMVGFALFIWRQVHANWG